MADNVTLNVMTGGAVAATDDIGGVHFQRTKMIHGADGVNDGDVSNANPMPARISNGTTGAGVEPFGAMMVNAGYQTLFYDSWSTSPIDTVDKWTVTGTAPTISGGNMQMSGTASTYNAIRTKDTIRPNVGFSHVRNGIMLETTAATGCGRFWGLGTPASVPSAMSLAQDGIGFEIGQATGALTAVTYVGGVRTIVATLTRPADGATHAYGLSFRVTRAYWHVDSLQVAVAELAFPNVQVVELPALIVRQNELTFVGVPTFTNIAHLTADTSRQGMLIADPVIGTRQARVNAAGALRVQQDTDFGRNARSFMLDAYTAAPAAEALQSVVQWYGNAAVAGTTTPAVVPTGKTLRLTSWSLTTKSLAAAGSAVMRIRANTAGVAVIGSPLVWSTETGSPAAVAGVMIPITGVFPDGFEFPAGTGLGFTLAGYSATGVLTLMGVTRFQVYGYEF